MPITPLSSFPLDGVRIRGELPLTTAVESSTPSSILPRRGEENFLTRATAILVDSSQLAASSRSCPFLEIGARSDAMQFQLSPLSSLQNTSPPVVPPKIEQAPSDSSRQSAPNSCFKLSGRPPVSRCQFFPQSLLR